MGSVSVCLGIVVIVSRLTTQAFGKPSSGPRGTSVGIRRTRVVIGVTITSWRTAYASLRERRTTGRRPAGGGRPAHQTSPRRITKRRWRGVARQRPRPPSPHGGSPAGGDTPPPTPPPAPSGPAP